jgi:hypothetical protein
MHRNTEGAAGMIATLANVLGALAASGIFLTDALLELHDRLPSHAPLPQQPAVFATSRDSPGHNALTSPARQSAQAA